MAGGLVALPTRRSLYSEHGVYQTMSATLHLGDGHAAGQRFSQSEAAEARVATQGGKCRARTRSSASSTPTARPRDTISVIKAPRGVPREGGWHRLPRSSPQRGPRRRQSSTSCSGNPRRSTSTRRLSLQTATACVSGRCHTGCSALFGPAASTLEVFESGGLLRELKEAAHPVCQECADLGWCGEEELTPLVYKVDTTLIERLVQF